MAHRSAALWALIAFGVCCSRFATAQPIGRQVSRYEAESIDIAFERLGLRRDVAPHGKRIESIDVVRLEVLEPRDPVPAFVRTLGNALHVSTREYVIRRELLFDVGDVYDQARADETERNLRRYLLQFSLVLVVPARGTRDDTVRLVVITKDVWSLRLNSDVEGFGTQANTLVLQPAETNLFGTGRTVFADLVMNPYTYWLGAGLVDYRVGGSQIAFRGEGRVAFECETGDAEGAYASFQYGKPLYTTRTRWAWQTAFVYQHSVRRLPGDYSVCGEPVRQERAVLDPDDPSEVLDTIPTNITTETIRGQIALTRSFGVPIKNDIGFGFETARFVERTEDLTAYDPRAARIFREGYLGTSDTRLGPYVQYHAYTTRFHRLLDVETLGLQEDFRLGHEIFLRAYPALRDLGSTRNLLGLFGSAAYTFAISDGFARPWASVEVQLSAEDQSDGEVAGGLRWVTPTLGFGRLVLDSGFRHRFENYFNPVVLLTGAGRLRGYDFSGFSGVDYLVHNLEFRTREIAILSVLFGAAAFYDVGDAFTGFDEFRPKHGAGGGLRVVFPQGQREVFRVDFGVPLSHGPDVDPHRSPRVVFSFGQAFDVPRPVPDALIVE